MNKKIRNMMVCIVACVVLVATLVILVNLPKATPPDTTVSPEKLKINNMSVNDIKTIEIKNPNDEYLVTVDGGNASIEQLNGLPVSQSKFSELCSDCSGVAASQIIDENAKDLSMFGLSSPKVVAKITYNDSTILTLNVGDVAPNSAGVYVSKDDAPIVYLFSSAKVDAFGYAKTEYIDSYITPEVKSGDVAPVLTNLKLEGTSRKQTVELSGDPNNGYNISLPMPYVAETNKVNDISKQLLGLKATKVVAINVTQSDIEKYNFSKPYSKVTAQYNDRNYTLMTTQPNNGYMYVMREGIPVIYQISGTPKSVFTDGFDELASKVVIKSDINTLKSLTITEGKNNYTFDIEHNAENSAITVKYKDNNIDEASFKTFYNNLIGVTKQSFTTEAINPNKLILTCVLTYTDASKPADTLSFYGATDATKVLISLNGACDSIENKTFTDKIISDCGKIVNNQSIDAIASSSASSGGSGSVSSKSSGANN